MTFEWTGYALPPVKWPFSNCGRIHFHFYCSLLLWSVRDRVGWKTTLWCEGQLCQLRKLSAKWFLNATSAALATPGQDCNNSSTFWMYNLQQQILNKPHNYYKVPEMIIGLCSGLLVSYISTVPAFHISVILYSSVIFTVVVLWFLKQQASCLQFFFFKNWTKTEKKHCCICDGWI